MILVFETSNGLFFL